MSALRELQVRFASALFDASGAAPSSAASDIVADGIEPAARLDIYRTTLHEGFIKALAIGFPVIERLVGADYFRQLALEFQRAHPSRAGNLHLTGLPFPGYLRERFMGSDYAYFGDVAALEWAHEEAMLAADATALTLQNFSDVDPARYDELLLGLHPACLLLRSPWPIVKIWLANQPDAAGDEVIDLREGGDNALVLRTEGGIEIHRLPSSDYTLLATLASGGNLGAALEAAQSADAAFDFGAALSRFLHLKVFARLHLPDAS